MKEMEKRINQAFPKALLHMEEENAFWEAYERCCDAKRIYEKADKEAEACRKVVFEREEVGGAVDVKYVNASARRKEAYQVVKQAFADYEAAEKCLQAISKEILKAKKARILAMYHIAKCEYLRLQREESMANLEKLIAVTVEQKEEADWKVAKVRALLDVARDELCKANNKVHLLDDFGEV